MAMARRLFLGVLLLAVLAPQAANAYLPHGFIGISPQGQYKRSDFELMDQAGIESLRLPFNWSEIEPSGPALGEAKWDDLDHIVSLAAESHLRVMPVLASSPDWATATPKDLPVESAFQRRAWVSFLRAAVHRYGLNGSFWEENPDLPFLPIYLWEVWNEENLVTFATEPDPVLYAKLVRLSGRVLHRADPRAKVILGGLFGQPLQIPPNLASGNFLARLYRAGNVKPYFDGVGLHPYVGEARVMASQLVNLRRIMRRYGDPRTPLYVTELAWGSDDGPTRWQRGLQGQAEQLSRSFEILSANRVRWGVGGAWWYALSDEGGTCIFCTSAGLLNTAREAKPSWYRFNEWTGGNPDTVPRALGPAR